MTLQETLYSTKFAIIIAGETSVGKTKTINNFIKSITPLELNLLSTPEINATKIPTIIHFCEKDKLPEVIFEGITTSYNTINEMVTWYNNSSVHCTELILNQYIELFLPTDNASLHSFVIIDMTGLNLKNKDKYTKALESIYKNFPNNCIYNY